MNRIAKALATHDEAYGEVAKALFGDGAYEFVAKAQQQGQSRKDRIMQNTAIGTNLVGSVAGPAAVGLAVRSARQNAGGMPRDLADAAAPKMQKSKFKAVRAAGQKAQRGANFFRNNKKAAVASGATLVGLQGINWGGDVLSAKLIGDQKKKDQAALKKSMPDGFDLKSSGTNAAKKITESRSPLARTKFIAEKIDDPEIRAKIKEAATKGASSVRVAGGAAKQIATDAKTNLKKNETTITWEGEFSKVDSDKRQAFGYASIVEMNGEPVVDRQGDYISEEELEKAAYDYVIKSRVGGDMHRRDGDKAFHGSDMIESFVITKEKIEKMGLPEDTPIGWWVGYKINDDEMWDAVKTGKRTGFSIHGKGIRKDMEL